MKKRIVIIIKIIITVIIIMISSEFIISKHTLTQNIEKSKPKELSLEVFIEREGFTVNNNGSLKNILTDEYPLQTLNNFFGTHPLNEAPGLNPNTCKSLNWETVNSKFPVQCLRYNRNSHYTVYRVKEGGYFYVFWSVPLKGTTVVPDSEKDIWVYFFSYINEIKNPNSFSNLKIKHSTAEDLFSIDESTELSYLRSSGIFSYTLLSEGKVLEVMYERNNFIRNKNDLLIKKIRIRSKESSFSCLTSITEEDLPNTQENMIDLLFLNKK